MGRVTDDWTPPAAAPEPVRREPTMRHRAAKLTLTSEKGKIVRYAAIILAFVAANLPAWMQSCEAKNTADDAAEKAEKVPAVKEQAKQTDAELDSTYRRLAEHVIALEKQLAVSEERLAQLERTLAQNLRRYRRPPRPVVVAKPPPLPPSPPASVAADLQEAR